eukprot:Gb_01833 [translate_table: standard]
MEKYDLGTNFAVTVLLLLSLRFGHAEALEVKLKLGKEKVTRLRFYMHDQVTGPNATAVPVASAPSTKHSPTLFGSVMVIDDMLTEGPEPTSKVVGRMQGLYAFSAQKDWSLLMGVNVVLQTGKFNGSTLTILGKNAVFSKAREMPIVGGSGLFRLARGYAIAKTYSLDLPNGVVKYVVTVVHY